MRSLPDLGREHAAERGLDVVDGVIDDVVTAQVHAGGLRLGGGLGVRLDVEAEDDGVGGGGEHHVRLVDGAHRAVDHLEPHLVRRQPLE